MTLLLRFITRTQLVRFRPFTHRLNPSLTTPIPPHQTVTLLQFSTKTSATCLRDRSPANDAQPKGFTPPTVRPANPPAPKASVGSVRHPVMLTEELSRNVIHLSCESTAKGGVCDVYLVGTYHRSKESKIQVRAIIDFLKPEAVFLELCSRRLKLLTKQEKKVDEESRRRVGAMVDFLKPEAVFLELCSSRLKPLTKKLKKVDEISGKFEVFTVSEFGVAYEEAIKYGGRVILGDRPEEHLRFYEIIRRSHISCSRMRARGVWR